MRSSTGVKGLLPLACLATSVLGGNILSTSGFSQCMEGGTVQVKNLDVSYDKDSRVLTFDVAGTSDKVQNVTAELVVTAYGKIVYTKDFSPCDTGMPQMCPVPAASFASQGNQTIPENYASQIPAIAFSIPDLDGLVKMQLKDADTGENVACVESTVGNGQTLQTPIISYVAVGMAAAALLLSGLAGIAAGGHPGASSPSPTFGEVIGWFQGLAMNGMMSVQYPQVYRSFTANFAFSTGLVPWGQLQTGIDNFRARTGGNLTSDSYEYLKNNATLVYSDGSGNTTTSGKLVRRALETVLLWTRDGTSVTVNGTSANIGEDSGSSSNTTSSGNTRENHLVSGIQGYVEQLQIPSSNTFLTVLLVFAIICGAIIVVILLFKVILEAWSMFGNIPKSMESWRKRYWWRLAKALTNLILLLYGTWTLYCIFQFTSGDSWAAKILAGVTLGLFTAVLAFFSWRIYTKAHQYKQLEGDASKLYEDKDTWVKYNLFYENYKKGYWWLFVPVIVYMFAKGCVIAGANGHGLVQTAGQLIVEAVMLIVLLWARPFQRRSGNWINIFIQVVRVISVVCILIFVEELGISQTTKTITGIILIVVQCILTGLLAILLVVNALINCIRENPHRKARKAAEKNKLERDLDDLTPLDARNSLLMEPMAQRPGVPGPPPYSDRKGRYDPVPRDHSPALGSERSLSRPPRFGREDDGARLVSDAASMGRRNDRSVSRSPDRQPTLPDVYGRAH
ncbi:hypothetical protein LTR78_010784 [Recurvomyces mirabilis]|uniref:ML-like domain-containing protein n=1 Tax=Recurvomyces mirabilis TaxID=574656 RepID=A0AAE0WGP6_9PEZI|nr:hypothetical protein LTR78_010784 [Recurvomyces mirabilis]KAK5149518.1 hypothetical protein LTS14_010884 [Recurvomyces mirabilis]